MGKETGAIKKRPRSSEGSGTSSNFPVQNATERAHRDNVYQISDSSDDEPNAVNAQNVIANIDLCDSGNDTDISIVDIINEDIPIQAKRRETDSGPSTSKEHAPAQDSGPSSLPNLDEGTDGQVASGQDLTITDTSSSNNDTSSSNNDTSSSNNDTSSSNNEDSVIYVRTDKYTRYEESPVDLTKQDPEEQNKPNCPICFEVFAQNALSATICGHIFCATCIDNCIKTKERCPTCRQPLTADMVHPLFLF